MMQGPDPRRLGDQPIEPKYLEAMKELGRFIDRHFNGEEKPSRVGFILMVFPFEHDGRCNYISNAERSTVVTMLKEQIRRFEGAPDVTGRA